MMALEDGTGTEESDNHLLKAASYDEIPQDLTRYEIVDNIPSPLVKLELHTSNKRQIHAFCATKILRIIVFFSPVLLQK